MAEKGYTDPTPIQQRAIPAVLAGRDVLAGAQTGTGKTAGFVLPILQRLGAARPVRPRALMLTPTRELAAQVAESARHYGKHTSTCAVAGRLRRCQRDARRSSNCATAATSWSRRRAGCSTSPSSSAVSLAKVQVFVLDEADRMLDMGFIHAIKRVLQACCRRERQNLMFSATYSDDIRAPRAELRCAIR